MTAANSQQRAILTQWADTADSRPGPWWAGVQNHASLRIQSSALAAKCLNEARRAARVRKRQAGGGVIPASNLPPV